MARIRMYTTGWCGYCDAARAFLRARNLPYEEIDLDGDPAFRARLFELTGRCTVPQVLVDGRPVGGYSELRELDRRGLLDGLAA